MYWIVLQLYKDPGNECSVCQIDLFLYSVLSIYPIFFLTYLEKGLLLWFEVLKENEHEGHGRNCHQILQASSVLNVLVARPVSLWTALSSTLVLPLVFRMLVRQGCRARALVGEAHPLQDCLSNLDSKGPHSVFSHTRLGSSLSTTDSCSPTVTISISGPCSRRASNGSETSLSKGAWLKVSTAQYGISLPLCCGQYHLGHVT